MTTIFYIITAFFVFYELTWLVYPLQKANDSRLLYSLLKESKGLKFDEYPKILQEKIKSKWYSVIFIIWIFAGLFSSQWTLFLLFILFNGIIIAPISKLTRQTFIYVILHFINSIIGFCLGIFLIINHYHLKIDVNSYLLSLF